VTDDAAAHALRAAAQVGEFFEVDLVPDDSWFPLRELLSEPTALDGRISRTRRGLAGSTGVAIDLVPLRTAASVDHLGLVARVLSPVLGASALAGVVPKFTPDNVRYRDDRQQLAVADCSGQFVQRAPAAAVRKTVIETVIAPLVNAYARDFRLSTKVLWGNVASALHGAVQVLDASGVAQRLPAADTVAALLRTPEFTGAVRATAPTFVRNSCCLWYRIPGTTVCGDCVLSG
jgi:hypothetical protein